MTPAGIRQVIFRFVAQHLNRCATADLRWLQNFCFLNSSCVLTIHGPGSLVGIVTDYGLDGPGSNPSGNEIFHLSRPALGRTQPPVKWVPGLSRGVKCGQGDSPPSSAVVMEE